MTINIASVINSDSALYYSEGVKVYSLISKEIKNKKAVTLSYIGLEKCTTQFLNAAIGKLYFNFNKSKLNSLLFFEDIQSLQLLKEKINDVIYTASKLRKDN